MERRARAHFRVVHINRWSLALAILIVLALLLLPGGRYLPVLSGQRVVAQGVTIWERDFSGRTELEARTMLQQMAETYLSAPVDAREAVDATGVSYVIPELNGYVMNVDATWTRLAAAEPNTRVEPSTQAQPAVKKLADFPRSVIRQGNPDKQAVGLLINVDWGEKELPKMLSVLKQRGVKATFFVSGRWAEKFPRLVKSMADDGHEIASHGYDLSAGPRALLKAGKLKADIARSRQAIQDITGIPIQYWAPHMSEVDAAIVKTAADLELRTVLYSVDTVDWKPGVTTEQILTKFRHAKAGDLILLHPKPATAQVLDQAVTQLQTRGLTPLTLSDMLSPDPDTSSPTFRRLGH